MTPTSRDRSAPGKYATSTDESPPWLNTPIRSTGTGAPRRKSKATASRPIVHPLFAECAKVATDPFWVALFSKAAYGKFPRKFSYRDKVLSYKRGSRVLTLQVPQAPIEALSAVTTFLRRHGGIISDLDQETNRLEQSRDLPSEAPLQWSGLRDKMREALLELFISDIKSRLNLTKIEVSKLRHTINVGVILGAFGKTNIILEDDSIVNIQGLIFHSGEPGHREFSIDPTLMATATTRIASKHSRSRKVEEPREDVSYLRDWYKALEKLDKKFALRRNTEPVLHIVTRGAMPHEIPQGDTSSRSHFPDAVPTSAT